VSRADFEELVQENAPDELGEVTPVSGLGDAAYQQVALFVFKGSSMVVVTVISDEPDSGTSHQIPLAQLALARLP
jgi:hypothetical protein